MEAERSILNDRKEIERTKISKQHQETTLAENAAAKNAELNKALEVLNEVCIVLKEREKNKKKRRMRKR